MSPAQGACDGAALAHAVGVLQGCQYGTDGCLSSGGFNESRYGSNAACEIRMCKDVTYTIQGFSLEGGGSECPNDALVIDGVR